MWVACAVALTCAGRASAEIVASGVPDGLLALGPDDSPYVSYVRGTTVFVARRVSKGTWRRTAAASVPLGSSVTAFRVGSAGPVVLAQSGDDRTLLLARKRGTAWETVRIARGLPAPVRLGWPGLALDGRGLPVVAYTRWNLATWKSQLFLVRLDARGRLHLQRITAEGFPQSYVPPPSAPVVVKGQTHVFEAYGYHTVVATIEWYPDKRTWTGLGIQVGRGDFPLGPVLAERNSAGTVFAAWTVSVLGFGAAPVALAARAGRRATAKYLLERALTTGLTLSSRGPEVAANEWVAADEVGLESDDVLWAGTVVSRKSQVELDGWIAGLAAGPRGRRDVLLASRAGLSWFRSRSPLATKVSIEATPSDGAVTVSGEVMGASGGKVTIYRERPGSRRTAVGQAPIVNGSFSLVDTAPAEPRLYRAVYTDPASRIPFAALLRPETDTIWVPGRARRGASGSLNP